MYRWPQRHKRRQLINIYMKMIMAKSMAIIEASSVMKEKRNHHRKQAEERKQWRLAG
jgi:hypothetical protein